MNLSLPLVTGWQGVPLFFVLSAYLLTSQWHGRALDIGSTLAFWRRRVLRIYPAFWLQLVVLVLLAPWVAGLLPPFGSIDLTLNAILWVNLPPSMTAPLNGVWWTLPVELSFYLALPLLVGLQRRVGWPAVAVACFVVTIGWRAGVMAAFAGENLALRLHIVDALPGSLATFAAGFAMAHSTWRPAGRERWAVLCALAVAYLCLQYWLWSNDALYLRGHWMLAVWIPSLSVVLAVGVHLAAQMGAATVWLGCRPLVWMGEVSFGVYLWHYPVLKLLGLLQSSFWNSLGGSVLALFACLALTLPLAALSFRFVESPTMGWGRSKANSLRSQRH
jgi:peptidoglycan/LPS O-acetylase OafA/YrhL